MLIVFAAVGPVDAPKMSDLQDTSPKTVTIMMYMVFKHNSKIKSISFYVKRASGQIVFQVFKRKAFTALSACELQVVAEWTTPSLTRTGWQQVTYTKQNTIH